MAGHEPNELEAQKPTDDTHKPPHNDSSNESDNRSSDSAHSNSNADGQMKQDEKGQFEVTLDPEEDPKNLPTYRKWIAVLVIAGGAACATCASSLVCRSVY